MKKVKLLEANVKQAIFITLKFLIEMIDSLKTETLERTSL